MGLRTVPQIFIHGRHVGGYEELAALEREGKLECLARRDAPRGYCLARHDPFARPALPRRAGAAPLGPLGRANLEMAEALIRRAAQGGAVYVQTPENTALMELKPELTIQAAQSEEPASRSSGSERSPPSSAFIFMSARSPSSSTVRASPTALI